MADFLSALDCLYALGKIEFTEEGGLLHYLIIDEAHRGTNVSDRAANKAQSIMQKFIKGSPEDGLCIMPLVIGVSATPQRFETLLAGTDSAVQKVAVPPEDVRESGLLKDRIIIHYPDMELGADMTMFNQAIHNWQKKCRHWAAYADRQKEALVKPILVIQVDDGSDHEATKTDLNICITFIAQLLGRMIRTPLARRIESDAELNNVSLFLPYFNEKTVKDVIKALSENEAVTPSETGTSKELITLRRDLAYEDVFAAMRNLVTYDVDSARKQPALRQLIALARALGNDDIDARVQRKTLWDVLDIMDQEVKRLREDGTYQAKREKITGFGMDAIIYEVGGNVFSYDSDTEEVAVTQHDIDRQFEQAGKRLGEGLHRQYWRRHADRNSVDVKTELMVMVDDTQAMETLEKFAEERFNALWDEHRFDVGDLPEARKAWYKRLIHSTATPVAEQWKLPDTIDFSVSDDSQPFDQHIPFNYSRTI